MSIATALVAGDEALPQLADTAIRQALEKAGLTHASGVLLFLTPDFARHAQQTVTAVARAAQCTQVAGGIAAGVFTEAFDVAAVHPALERLSESRDEDEHWSIALADVVESVAA